MNLHKNGSNITREGERSIKENEMKASKVGMKYEFFSE